jgi:hypothetical protein
VVQFVDVSSNSLWIIELNIIEVLLFLLQFFGFGFFFCLLLLDSSSLFNFNVIELLGLLGEFLLVGSQLST